MVRMIRPPGAFSWAPNTCSIRARTLLFLRLASTWASDSGWFRDAVMDAASEAALVEFHLGLSRAIGAVGVHVPRCVGIVQKTIQLLAVVH